MKLLDYWQALISSRLAAAADVGVFPFALAWTVCLALNRDLLVQLAPLTAMGSRMPQLGWTLAGALVTSLEIHGLVRRALGRDHRPARLWAMIGMGTFFAWIGGELAVRNPGLPGAWYFGWLAFWCLLGIGRLLQLREADQDLSRL